MPRRLDTGLCPYENLSFKEKRDEQEMVVGGNSWSHAGLMLVFGLIVAGCDNGTTPIETNETFIITGLSEYNGKYVKAYGEDVNSNYIIPAKDDSGTRDNYFLLIEGGSAGCPTLYDEDEDGNLIPSTRTGLFKFEIDIYPDTLEGSNSIMRKTFPSISIINGKGSINWADVE
jgi:hypothetical protein